MSTIKKAYKEIVDLLENNRDTKVKHIIDQVIALASAKSSRSEGSSYIKDAEGTPVAIFDYYFKRHMPLVGDKAVEFGAKAKTATGFNTMCKEGVSHWTKQQKEAKNANTALLSKVASGEIAPDAIVAHQEEIETARKTIAETELGFETIDELNAYLTESGVVLA